ncbi:hypothetical protein IWX84_000742 [Flavobacterium sp. CG_9.10]|nr:hypothetical protein [Flavobacterium sp. CG_9.10]
MAISLFFFGSLYKYKDVLFLISFLLILEVYHFLNFTPNYDLSVVRVIVSSFIIGFGFSVGCKSSLLITYIKIIHFLSIISLIIFGILLISESAIKIIESFFDPIFRVENEQYGNLSSQVNPIFYNFDYNFYLIRNNGPFWEPTIFASLLILSIIFNLILFKKIINKYSIVSFITLITTFSSTGYVSFAVLVLGLILLSNKIILIKKMLLMTVLLTGSFILFNNTTFLKDKIFEEFINREDAIQDKGGDSRIASTILDWREVTEQPEYFLFGKGSDKRVRIGINDKNVLRNNGLTALLVQRGILFTVFYLYGIYNYFYFLCYQYEKNKKMAIAFFISILVLSTSEILFDLVFFHMLAILGFILKYDLIKKVSNKKICLKYQ